MNQRATSEPEAYQTERVGGVPSASGVPAAAGSGAPTAALASRGRARVALIGGGTVGAAVVSLLEGRPEFELVGVLVRDASRRRAFPHADELVTADAGVLADADVVVEVAGGTGRPADLALRPLARGLPLVTANKAALAERWDEFLPHAREGRVHFEAAVMAGTPSVGILAGCLRGSRPLALHAVLNGTCNVILAAMEQGGTYGSALGEAQRLGYAEADPTLDVEGLDAAHKLTVLGRLAFAPDLGWPAVRARTRGISGLTPDVMERELARGRHVRLVGSVVPEAGSWTATVRPVSLPHAHPLLTTGATNALLFAGDPIGQVVVRGPGAGGGATASGVVADLSAAVGGVPGPLPLREAAPVPIAGPAASEALEEP